jgi:amino acid adenylation domain-containing protein
LFQAAFTLQNASPGRFELPGLAITPLLADSGTAKFDLTLIMTDAPEGLRGLLEYNTDLFEPETIQRMANHFQAIVAALLANPDQAIAALPMLSPAERRQLLVDWNRTMRATPAGLCVHELFEERAAGNPDALALSFQGQSISYGELNQRANRLAHHLCSLGVGPDILVGVAAARGPELIIAILAALKAGGAYLPLDPNYPADRLAFMLRDSRVPVLLTQADLVGSRRFSAAEPSEGPLPGGAPAGLERLALPPGCTVFDLDRGEAFLSRYPATNLQNRTGPENLAYVIYTSGSTGRPKGALLSHRGLVNLVEVQREAFSITPGSRVLQFSPLSFDASVWEMFMALANGATLCLAPQEILASPPDLASLLREQQVTNVTLPPSVLRVLPADDLPSLQTVISAGEACTPDLVARWAPGRAFFNAYGPTETTVCAALFRCDPRDPASPPIGKPIVNTKLYVLDPLLQPVPIGVPGELHVAGISLARGYLNRPELTAERFIPNPFVESEIRDAGSENWPFEDTQRNSQFIIPNSRLYRTGDLVRYRADGNLEFLGRLDQQVKVRGFRIELGEIEAALSGHPQVHAAALVAREERPGDMRLVAYVVPAEESAPKTGDLRSYLRRSLPEYMVPAAFVFLESLPVSPSGKVDRQGLPALEGARPELEQAYVAPRGEVETRLAALAAELLGLDQIGIYDNFFELGGHSLLATQFVSRVREIFAVDLPLRELFEHPNVAELAERVADLLETGQRDADKIAEALALLGRLSGEEVQALLAEKELPQGEGRRDG